MSNDATDGCYFNEELFVEGIALEQINSTVLTYTSLNFGQLHNNIKHFTCRNFRIQIQTFWFNILKIKKSSKMIFCQEMFHIKNQETDLLCEVSVQKTFLQWFCGNSLKNQQTEQESSCISINKQTHTCNLHFKEA